jgi:hypothetical protein
VTLYWSATVYNRATHALIRNMPPYSRASNRPGLQSNADGSVDNYFGPKAPAGTEMNWIHRAPAETSKSCSASTDRRSPLLDKSWKLPDIELVAVGEKLEAK